MTCFDSTFMQRSFSSCRYRSTRLPGDTARLGVIPQSCVPFQSAPAFPSCFRLSLEHTLTRVPPGKRHITHPKSQPYQSQAKPSRAEPKAVCQRKDARSQKAKKADLLQRPFWPFETRSDVCVYIQFACSTSNICATCPLTSHSAPCAAGASFSLLVRGDVFIWVLFRFISFPLLFRLPTAFVF